MAVSDKAASLRLVKHGFIKKQYKSLYKFDKESQSYVVADPKKLSEPSPSHADEEVGEEINLSGPDVSPQLIATGFPNPFKRYKLIFESFNASMEETYYWLLGHLRQDRAFPRVDKITDVFSAAENSAFFGQSAQRLSIQEDRASGFLRGIAELVKQLFQIVRELRMIDERLVPYEEWAKKGADGKVHHSKSADSTLKGFFTDFAENKGGQMQPGSLFHLAQNVGYASLPDLFFNTHVYTREDVDKVVDGLKQFNPNVRNVLKRKLYQFVVWKEKTHEELTSRRRFQIRYLRQHWAVIKMYMAWTKPYLKHIKRLTMNESQLDSPDIIGAFETSMTEVEILAIKPPVKGYHPCVLLTFQFNTRPIMQYRQEYQQGPVHVGRITFSMRGYAWTDQQIADFKLLRAQEDRDLLGLVDESVQMAMDELGDDLERYLNESGKDVFDQEVHGKFGKAAESHTAKKPTAKPLGAGNPLEPVTAIFSGAWELFSALVPTPNLKVSAKKKVSGGDPKAAHDLATKAMWQTYKNYKKSHGLVAW